MKTRRLYSILNAMRKPMACFMLLCLLNGQFLWAIDDVTGLAGYTQSGDRSNTTVDLSTTGPIINWNNLSTNAGDNLNFGGGSAVLNRVAQAVEFNGNLNAAGIRVYVVSPNGVQIGSTAVISAAKFVASGLNISDDNFMNGIDQFQPFNVGDGMTMIGQVQNDGTIQVTGDAYLLGSKVLNKGTIVSEGGLILMATGNQIIIGEGNSDVAVVMAADGAPFQIAGSDDLDPGDVVNRGTLNNGDGQIVLAAGDTFVQAIADLNAKSGSVSVDPFDGPDGIILYDNGCDGEVPPSSAMAGNITVVGDAGNAIQEGVINDGETAASALVAISAVQNATIAKDSSTQTKNLYMTGETVKVQEAVVTDGDVALVGDKTVVVDQALTSGGQLAAYAGSGVTFKGPVESTDNMDLNAGSFVSLSGDAVSGGSMTVTAKTFISSPGSFLADDDLTVTAGDELYLWGGDWVVEDGLAVWDGDQTLLSENGRVQVNTDIKKDGAGQLFITSAKDDGGANDFVAVDLNGDVIVPGNLYVSGFGDIELSAFSTLSGLGSYYYDTYTAFNTGAPGGVEGVGFSGGEGVGGVSIRSAAGKIYTAYDQKARVLLAENSDMMDHVWIEGFSRDNGGTGVGVDLPYGDGKAAIVLQSQDTLELGGNTRLYAEGMYLAAGEGMDGMGVDDRPGADLLETDGTVIGGSERNEGDPIDIAIYAGSTEGDVIVHGNPETLEFPFMVNNRPYMFKAAANDKMEYRREFPERAGDATVVLDAKNKVEFPELEQELAILKTLSADELAELMNYLREVYGGYDDYEGEDSGYRLEVVSRVTEWLFQAVDNKTLPFADNPEIMELLLANDYVLRGSGQANAAIQGSGETRAWVLENPDGDPGVAPLAVLALPELKGCPVEMDAAAAELAMNSDDLQLLIGNSLATNPNLQPCKACQKLVTAASILNDADGARMAAMNQIFNTLAPIDAPFTPEVSASVATAFANLSNENPQYALANEYINAFVAYVAVISDDLQAPVGDPVAFTLEKHGQAITGNENPNVAAYVMTRLQASGESI